MKFDFVIGNPPYNQDFNNSGENGNFAKPVFNEFMDAANTVADHVELIHPARFLFNAGSTPKAWNEKMLADPHFKVLHYEEDANKIFANTDIKGGIAITYRAKDQNFGAIEVFTKDPILNTIRGKVAPKLEGKSLADIIYTQCKFDLEALYAKYPKYKKIIGSGGKDKRFRNNIFKKIDAFTEKPKHKTDIPVLGVLDNKRCVRYIDANFVDNNHENLHKWKALLARANGSGQFGTALSSIVVLKPGEAYTQTFIGVGAFDSEQDARNAASYLKTKFARAMLGILKVTQDNDREVWRMVPLQDFTEHSDIDWSVSIAEIDKQLYKKYGLSEEEISFIETNVKEME